MLFFANSLIFARLLLSRLAVPFVSSRWLSGPVLKPYLYRSFRHTDILRNTFSHGGGGSGIFVKFNFESDQLVLSCPLPLLILLLLSEGAFASRPTGGGGGGCRPVATGCCDWGRRSGRRHSVERSYADHWRARYSLLQECLRWRVLKSEGLVTAAKKKRTMYQDEAFRT